LSVTNKGVWEEMRKMPTGNTPPDEGGRTMKNLILRVVESQE